MDTLSPLPHHLLSTASRYPDYVAQRDRDTDGGWREWTYAELLGRVRRLGSALIAGGLEAGQRVALMAPNCPEWTVVDYATTSAGGVLVPLHRTSGSAQQEYVLRHSAPTVMAVQGDEALTLAATVLRELGTVRQVLVWDASAHAQQAAADTFGPQVEVLDLHRLLATADVSAAAVAEWEDRCQSAALDDLATVLFTSGTTGTPKAVPLTHRNLTTQFATIAQRFDIQPGMRSISFLPLSHAFERAWVAFGVMAGVSISYCPDPREVADLLPDVRPQVMISVPRLFERVYGTVMATATGPRAVLLRAALRIGHLVTTRRLAGEPVALPLRLTHQLADRLVLRRIRRAVGGPKACFAVGGAALRPEVEEFFLSVGIVVSPGYGLTETSPVITCCGPHVRKTGTVGRAVAGMEIRVVPDAVATASEPATDGEIQVRGPGVMSGYLPEADGTDHNEAAFADGWFRTGDRGYIDREGFLHISGRTKDLIVTDGGFNVAPAPIESDLEADPLIEHAVVIGEGRPYLIAVVQVASDQVGEGGSSASAQELKSEVTRRVTARTSHRSQYEQIRTAIVVTQPFTMESGELTPTLKVKRQVVQERWSQQISQEYERAANVRP